MEVRPKLNTKLLLWLQEHYIHSVFKPNIYHQTILYACFYVYFMNPFCQCGV
jgi:hypothetical protein